MKGVVAKRVIGVYFSPTGTTKEIIGYMTTGLADRLQIPYELYSYTYPFERTHEYVFTEEDLVIWGTPVYAGRIPNKTLSYVSQSIQGNGCRAIPVVVYGNRSFDHALSELANILQDGSGHIVGAAAMVARHAFSETLAQGRPDHMDWEAVDMFLDHMKRNLESGDMPKDVILDLPGEPKPDKYYTPKKENGEPAIFLKAKPQLKEGACTRCGVCVSLCPMGSIVWDARPFFQGTCIKCQACLRGCENKAICFEDEAFLSHVRMIESHFSDRKDPQFWT